MSTTKPNKKSARRVVIVAIAFGLIVNTLLAGTVAASDIDDCVDPGPLDNRWSQNWVSGQKHGAYASIEGQALHQCIAAPIGLEYSGSFVFANGTNNTNFYNIIQIGKGICRSPFFPNDCDSTMRYYWAYGRSKSTSGCTSLTSSLNPYPRVIQQDDGLTHSIKVWHHANKWSVYLAGVERASLDEIHICWTPTNANWFGESWDGGDAIGGTSANHYTISAMQYTNTEGGSFQFTNFAAGACGSTPSGEPWTLVRSIHTTPGATAGLYSSADSPAG